MNTFILYCYYIFFRYCEERPLLLGNSGMGARLCTYYQKSSPGDQTGTNLRNGPNNLGNVLTLDPADKSPFLGDIKAGSTQSCLETNMYRAPVYPHKVSSTDYLLIRSAKGKLTLRRIDRIYVVGQQVCFLSNPLSTRIIFFKFLVLPSRTIFVIGINSFLSTCHFDPFNNLIRPMLSI